MNYFIKLSIAMLLACFPLKAYCQNIKIADFIQLCSNKKEVIETKLNSFNIHLYDTNELNNGRTQFTFQNESEMASNFHYIDFLYIQDAKWNNRLSFQTQEMDLIKKYLAEIKNLGFKFANNKIVDRRIYDVYTDGESTIEIIRTQIKNNLLPKSYYIFAFYDSDEYKHAFATENKVCSVAPSKKNSLFDN